MGVASGMAAWVAACTAVPVFNAIRRTSSEFTNRIKFFICKITFLFDSSPFSRATVWWSQVNLLIYYRLGSCDRKDPGWSPTILYPWDCLLKISINVFYWEVNSISEKNPINVII
jgi:hypothetical protein